MNYQLTGHPENFKIKLYDFQERLSLRYNISLKLLSLTSKRTYFLKSIPEVEDSLFYFLLSIIVSSIIVSVISYSHIIFEVKSEEVFDNIFGKMFFK